EAEDSGKLDEAREEALEAKKAAKEAKADKYATEDWNTGEGHLAKAEEKESARYYGRAQKAFIQARRNAQKNSAALEEIFGMKEEYEKVREQAKKAGAETLLKASFQETEERFANAVERLEEGKKSSKGMMRNAVDDMKLIVEQVEKKKKIKQRAEEAKAEELAAEQRAIEAEAEQHAAVDMDYARTGLRQASQALEDGKFETAERGFLRAKNDFAFAIDNAQRAKQGLEIVQRPADSGDGENNGLDNGDDWGSGEIDPGGIVKPTPGGGDVEPEYGLGDINSALARLFQGSHVYSGGMLQLSYNEDGQSLSKDVAVGLGKIGENVVFTGKEHTATDAYSVAGNYEGFFVVKAGYKNKIKMVADIQFQLFGATQTHFLELLLLWNPSTQSGYALQIGQSGISGISYKDGNPTAGKKSKYTKDANRWLDRKVSHTFEIIIKPEEGARSGDDADRELTVAFDGEMIIQMKANSWSHGFCGMRWKDAKWYAKSLELTGELDEDWAKDALKKVGSGDSGGSGGGSLDF
ncbi:MAG: hypothetical protein KDC38_12835, partial [Planctomycetes bacterium]|nr:hypothetical protein [Planctomycetota bacterium]